MTLNVTVLTSIVIYQSADFRLTNPDTGKPRLDPSPKTVILTYFAWEGFVTYTGVGNWNNRDVSDYVTDWLTGITRPSMVEVASVIENKGTEFLRRIERRTSHRFMHTFTLAGFHEQVPQVYVISNYEDCFGNSRTSVDDHLTITTRTLGQGEKATVIVTGYKPAVPRVERRLLGTVATKYPGDGLRISRRIAKLNAEAAPRSEGVVSKECIVLSFRPDGTGATLLSGEGDQVPRQLPHIANGIDTNKLFANALRNAGIDISQVRAGPAAFASLRPGQESNIQKTACNYAILSPEPSSNYKVVEIQSSEFELIGAGDINDRGEIVGTGRAALRSDQPQNIPWSCVNGEVERLNYSGLASAINNEGHVAAVLQGISAPPPSWQRAAVYIRGILRELPLYHAHDESPERSDSQIGAINSSSLMVGSVAVQYDKSGLLKKFAAVFRLGQAIQVFEGVGPSYTCGALDVNDQGQVLLMVEMRPFDLRSILWNTADDSWHFVGDETTNVFPIAVNDHGAVLGQARNKQNDPISVVCQLGGKWEPLGVPDKWIPVDINNECQVVGRTVIDLLERPWLRESDGRIVMLPYLTDHHTSSASINNFGQIVGGAWTDKCSHALSWSID